ncbi:hypothetical protein CANARDRAFT_10429 [[Candida] arabinofermentans NRRL YB-2248]|uniref:Mitochondrial carrier protein n=1 Tax=[Candida] arabinofermentans NRRL YB-2248 TaxID=983967 RepID=A0A1E4SSS4_9ASCO|nr:hypothetical protein CANARDRAFT_10429 [[Candida] arabinofermentans NRRL YB-2248]
MEEDVSSSRSPKTHHNKKKPPLMVTYINSSLDTRIFTDPIRPAKNQENAADTGVVYNGAQQLSHRNTQVVSLSSAGIRSLIFQFTTLYMRNPAKLFRPSRFDYLTPARALLHGELASKPWSFRTHSGIAVLYQSIKREGWDFIPRQVLPPLIANSAVGVILYSTYLTTLQYFNGFTMKTMDDPHPFDTFRAGFLAGAAASVAASPIDALYARSTYAELVSGKHSNLWEYGRHKLKQIGLAGIFSGFGLNFFKESLGFAFYFSIFEFVKNQGYHRTQGVIDWYQYWKARIIHGEKNPELVGHPNSERALQLSFILLAGASAAFSLLAIQYPFNKIQKVHLTRLEALDLYNEANHLERKAFYKLYYNSYIQTFEVMLARYKKSHLSLFGFFYRGFVRTTLTSIPATSIGLLVFEISRQRLSIDLAEEYGYNQFQS